MQEEVEQRIVSLMISCGKLGEQEFRKAVAKLLEQLKNDYQKYLWVWEGECLGLSDAQIFRGKYVVENFETVT